MLRRILMLAVTVALLGTTWPLAGAEPSRSFDWQAWKSLPVYPQDQRDPNRGRVMPLDTFARDMVEVVCGKANPTLQLKGAVPEADFNSPGLAAARSLFPNDKPRKFQAIELLYSWLIEPEKWEHVPFLLAEHQELREELLDVPFTDAASGAHLKFVSPSTLETAENFQQRLVDLDDKQRQARANGEKFELTGVDKKVEELVQAYNVYKQVVFDPHLDGAARSAYRDALGDLAETWLALDDDPQLLDALGEHAGMAASVTTARESVKSLALLVQERNYDARKVEPVVSELVKAADALAARFGQLANVPDPEGMDAARAAEARQRVTHLAADTERLKSRAYRLLATLFANDESLRLVPALNAAALSSDRDAEEAAAPWLDLQTLLEAPAAVLEGYSAAEVQQVRDAFQRARLAYQEGRATDFADFSRSFAQGLADLAASTEPARAQLPKVDPEYLAHTAYPAAGHTAAEVRYNTLDPFKWSWGISLLALACFALAFGLARKPLFWLGMGVLAAGLVWAAYGFYLRVSVTRWAPVTNMYETVIYVPFFVSVLAIWFALLPILSPGMKRAWQLTAIPGTWEAGGGFGRALKTYLGGSLAGQPAMDTNSPRGKEQALGNFQFSLANLLMLVPRGALAIFFVWLLTVAPYAAGDRTIINLLPNRDVGATLPDFNDFLTWAVGMCVLVPAVWYLPRVVLTALSSFVLVPMSLAGRLGELLPQVYNRRAFVGAATFVGTLCWYVAWDAPILDASFTPLQPVLRDNFWLTIHVLTIVSSYGAGALAWGLGNIALMFYLFGKYRDPVTAAAVPAGHRPASGTTETEAGRRPPEACSVLASYIYKAIQVAVLLLAAGTILGGLWADVSWGRFWGWDPKEIWALISLLTYLAILHGRFAGLFGNFGLAAGSVLGATAIIFSWYGVNFYLGAGLHTYGFGAGGQAEVMLGAVTNWVVLGVASVRYWIETSSRPEGGQPASETPQEEPAAVGTV